MLIVPIRQARPKMRLAVDILHPRTGQRLLTKGYELDEHLIEKLGELGINEIWIDYPRSIEIQQYVSPRVQRHRQTVVASMANMFSCLHDQAYADLDFGRYRKTLRGLIEAFVKEPMAASYLEEMSGASTNDLRHAGEVSFLSILLGLKVQGYLVAQRRRLQPQEARSVVDLALGAMLHDVGMLLIDPEVRSKWSQKRDENDVRWQQHVYLGHHELTGQIPSAAAGVLLHHHQYFDGSGFPGIEGGGGLAGEDIHVFARIACVADHFDRIRRPDNDTVVPRVRVLHEMMHTDLSRRFDPVILAALPQVVPAFAPGSMVILNTGVEAVVCRWHPKNPCRPTVLPIERDEDPDTLSASVAIDLREHSCLSVVEQDGCDVRDYLFEMAEEETARAV